MYLTYFGFSESPFSNTPDRRFVYLSDRHREGLAHLLYALGEQGGFVQLTGEVGTGKTTLCRYFLERIPSDVDVALIVNPMLTAPEMLATVCDELGIAYPAGTTSLKILVDALHRRLLDAHERGRRVVLIVDEAQHLSVEVFEQMRLLTNLETAKAKLLQIILIGQPELIELLSRRELRQVAQRVAARYHLLPLSERETRAYILYRLGVGGQAEPVFDDSALWEVYRATRGVPRLINLVCDRALLGAYATRKSQVSAPVVRRAAQEVSGELQTSRGGTRRWRPAYAVVIGVLVIAGAALAMTSFAAIGWRPWSRHEAPPAPAKAAGPTSAAPKSAGSTFAEPAKAAEPVRPVRALPGRVPAVPLLARRDLAAVLADPAVPSDKASAFAAVYSRWGVDTAGVLARDCPDAQPGGLRCTERHGTWNVLRRLDLPAVLELVSRSGRRHYATLAALDDTTATLGFGRERFAFALAEIERTWDGGFMVFWKAPRLAAVPIVPGARGRDVVWLRERLAEIEGTEAVATEPDFYDEALRVRVIAFQRGQSLVADGLVGEETLARLTAVLDAAAPSLGSRRSPS